MVCTSPGAQVATSSTGLELSVSSSIGALSAMTWMPYYPIWSLTYVGIAVLVFYALARHGGRVA